LWQDLCFLQWDIQIEKSKILHCKKASSNTDMTPVAGLIFETKNREIFLETFFWRDFSGEKLLPVQLCSH